MSTIEHENIAKLARMAGQIAVFYRAYPAEQAARDIAIHINKFWTPRMRADFLAAFGDGDERLDPLVRAARAGIRRAQAAGDGG